MMAILVEQKIEGNVVIGLHWRSNDELIIIAKQALETPDSLQNDVQRKYDR